MQDVKTVGILEVISDILGDRVLLKIMMMQRYSGDEQLAHFVFAWSGDNILLIADVVNPMLSPLVADGDQIGIQPHLGQSLLRAKGIGHHRSVTTFGNSKAAVSVPGNVQDDAPSYSQSALFRLLKSPTRIHWPRRERSRQKRRIALADELAPLLQRRLQLSLSPAAS